MNWKKFSKSDRFLKDVTKFLRQTELFCLGFYDKNRILLHFYAILVNYYNGKITKKLVSRSKKTSRKLIITVGVAGSHQVHLLHFLKHYWVKGTPVLHLKQEVNMPHIFNNIIVFIFLIWNKKVCLINVLTIF